MKRFFCKICKKVKRVQRFPVIIENQEADDPTLRVGECRRHHESKPVKATRIVKAEWTEANKVQAEGRFNRKAVRKAAR
jgi:hypothetical protein